VLLSIDFVPDPNLCQTRRVSYDLHHIIILLPGRAWSNCCQRAPYTSICLAISPGKNS